MSNQALPQASRQLLDNYLTRCQNLGLILDKYAPWGPVDRGNWDLTMRSTIRRRGQNQKQMLTGGEAKGLWLSTSREALNGESPSVFEVDRADMELLRENYARWQRTVKDNRGIAFTMKTSERLVAGLGASHVLETALTLERNTGAPYLPGSTVKGLARAWGLLEVASQLGVSLDHEIPVNNHKQSLLNVIADTLISEPHETVIQAIQQLRPVSENAETLIQWFRFIFGSQAEAGTICFIDAKYAGNQSPDFVADVMPPHYIDYYTENGGKPPAEDDNPNPVSFITVNRRNTFAFGLIPRLSAFDGDEKASNLVTALDVAAEWLSNGLSQLGIGSKTAAGYGFFNRKSLTMLIEHNNNR